MAIIDGKCACGVCGSEDAEFNELWMDWVCEMCVSGSWRMEIKRRVDAHVGGVTFATVLKKVAETAGFTSVEICAPNRKREIVEARQVAMTIALAEKLGTLRQVGIEIGGKDHCTVLYAVKTVRNLFQTDQKFREKWQEILKFPEETSGRYLNAWPQSGGRKKKEKKVCGK